LQKSADKINMKREREKPSAQKPANPCDALCKVPVFRPVAIQLLSLLSQEELEIFDVAELLNSDPGFSAEFLTTANSAAYSVSRRVNTVERAVLILGIERTKVLVTRAALQGMVRGLEENVAIENCWLHSRATASIAAWLSKFYRLHQDRAYTVGLMHDIGRLGLLAAHTGHYAELLNRISGSHAGLLEAERLLFSIDHCEAGAWLTRTWGLPEEFRQTSAHHHEPLEGIAGSETDLVKMACCLAHAMGFKAAPLIDSEPAESILERIPDLPGPPRQFSLADLSTFLQGELQVEPASLQ